MRAVRVTPFRVGLAIVAVGLVLAGYGLAFGGNASTIDPAEQRQVEAPHIVPKPEMDGPEPMANQPGGRSQLLVFGALVTMLGGLVAVASRSITPRPNAGLEPDPDPEPIER